MTDIKSIEPGSQASSDIALEFGNRLKIARGQLHLSQKEFAAQLDVAGSYLSEIEAGKTRPGFEFFYKTSRIFKINPVYLLHGQGSVFLDTEKSWYHDIDFGTVNREVQDLVWHMANAPTIAHAMLEYFARYYYANQDLIRAEIRRIREEKENQEPFFQTITDGQVPGPPKTFD